MKIDDDDDVDDDDGVGGGGGGGGGGGKTGKNKMHYGRCARVANKRLTEGYPELEAEYEIQ